MGEVWLFVLGVNLWNVLDTGLMGSMIIVPVLNYTSMQPFSLSTVGRPATSAARARTSWIRPHLPGALVRRLGPLGSAPFLGSDFSETPKTSFSVSDFWRWLEVDMCVKVTFETFTAVIVAYRYREVGIVSVGMELKRDGLEASLP